MVDKRTLISDIFGVAALGAAILFSTQIGIVPLITLFFSGIGLYVTFKIIRKVTASGDDLHQMSEKYINLFGAVFVVLYLVVAGSLIVSNQIDVNSLALLFPALTSVHFFIDLKKIYTDYSETYSLFRFVEKLMLVSLLLFSWIELLVSF